MEKYKKKETNGFVIEILKNVSALLSVLCSDMHEAW